MSSTRLTPTAFTDLEIRLLPLEPEGYPVEITLGGGQQFPRGYLKPDLLPWAPGASPAADGERLFNLLLADDRLKAAWAEARGQTPRRRIRLRIDAAAPELHIVPWELLRDASPDLIPQTLSADADTPFSRYLAGPWRTRPPAQDDLAAYGLAPVDLPVERQVIQTACRGLGTRLLAITLLESPVTLATLEAELRKGYHVLHIVAHGAAPDNGQPALLVLADSANRVALVTEDELAEMLARQSESLQLVYLDACHSATRSPADAFRGFAPKLVAAGIPAVMAMQDLVPVATSQKLTGAFYRWLLQHGQVDLASNEARSALLSDGEAQSWGIPVLYSRVRDGAILEPMPRLSIGARLRQLPIVAQALAVGGALLSVLSVIALVLGLFSGVQEARQPGGLLAGIWPAPTATFTATPTATSPPTATPTASITPTATPTPIVPMPEGFFNIAVAEFTPLDATGSLTLTQASRRLSDWLFAAIRDQIAQVPDLSAYYRGPGEIGVIDGRRLETRAVNAALVAQLHNATILVYGVVTAGDDGYYVEPEFYVSSKGFGYGSEVVGPDRLGEKVRFGLPLLDDPAPLNDINQELRARRRALQRLVSGLTYYYYSRYENSWAEFYQASVEWGAARGQEVVEVLKGAAQLRIYDAATDSDQRNTALKEAEKVFAHARELNPDYARSYLGLGSVAIQQVTTATTAEARQQTLIGAQQWYSMSLAAIEQPPSAYVPAKAAFGLGQVHLKGFEQGLSDWSADEARNYFSYVVRDYDEKGQPPDLTWFAGHSYAYLGWIAGHDQNWAEMAARYRGAIGILSRIPGNQPLNWIARYWANTAFAEEKQKRLEDAKTAYRLALQNGKSVLRTAQFKAVATDELDQWQQELDRLEKGAP